KPLAGRPTISRSLSGRARVRTLRDGGARATLLNQAAVFVPAFAGMERVALEAAAAGTAGVSPPGIREPPAPPAAAAPPLREDDAFRERSQAVARAEAEGQSFAVLAREADAVYGELAAKRKRRPRAEPLPVERDWISADLHLHTSWSHDCQIPVEELLDYAEAQGLGAIAVTDHNVVGGALEAVEQARDRNLVVIPGEEVKTDGQGEVIGLFLKEEIPRGLSFGDTVAAIKKQGGLVYLPHPFDRLHAIPE